MAKQARVIVCGLFLTAVISACSSPIERRQANDSDSYAELAIEPKLQIPEGLNEPTYSKEYSIPEVGSKAAETASVGKYLDIRPPLQVLPMADGTRVENADDHIKLMVDSIDDDIDLKQEMFDILNSYLTYKEIEVVKQDYDLGIIETDWIQDEQVLESGMWSDKIYTLRQRYQFDINVRPHGRSGSLKITLVEHEESYDGLAQDIILSGEDKRRYTIDALNNVSAYMNIKRKKALKAKQIRESLGIDVELVKGSVTTDDNIGEASYWLAQASYERTWKRLIIVLPELGFEIVDMNRKSGLYYLEVSSDSGFWSTLLDGEELPIEDGLYQMLLQRSEDDKNTKIYLQNHYSEPLENELIESVYHKISSLMQEVRKQR